MYVEPHERMTQEQAEQAKRAFEYPGWQCVGIEYRADELSWVLQIAPAKDPADYHLFVVSHWRLYWKQYLHAMAAMRAGEDYVKEHGTPPDEDFIRRYYDEHPFPEE